MKVDLAYAGADNFAGVRVYPAGARLLLQRPAAEALVRASARLRRRGFGLLLRDGYRPWHVTRFFWDAVPPDLRAFVADPAKGSRHNRGMAVDLTLYDLVTGEPVTMPGSYDEFSSRSYLGFRGGSALQRWRRDLLAQALRAEGFEAYDQEWWHHDFAGWRGYPIMNRPLDRRR